MMTNLIQSLPGEILGKEIIPKLNNFEDVIACTSVCKEWCELIKTNLVSSLLIKNLFPLSSIERKNPYGVLQRLCLEQFQKLPIQSKDIDDLNAIATEFDQMARSCDYHQSDYKTRICDKLNQLPERIQRKLYNDLYETFKASNRIIYDCAEWGKKSFHSADHRRDLPNCRDRREAILNQVNEEKLLILARTLLKRISGSCSERDKEKAIRQFSQLPQGAKDGVYLKLEELLIKHSLFCPESGKTAFYDDNLPKSYKGRAIILYVNSQRK
jgi:hypothetical protein